MNHTSHSTGVVQLLEHEPHILLDSDKQLHLLFDCCRVSVGRLAFIPFRVDARVLFHAHVGNRVDCVCEDLACCRGCFLVPGVDSYLTKDGAPLALTCPAITVWCLHVTSIYVYAHQPSASITLFFVSHIHEIVHTTRLRRAYAITHRTAFRHAAKQHAHHIFVFVRIRFDMYTPGSVHGKRGRARRSINWDQPCAFLRLILYQVGVSEAFVSSFSSACLWHY